MTLVWTADQRSTVCRNSEQGYPDEVCGILIGVRNGDEKTVREVVAVANTWENIGERRRRFTIAPDVLLREERRARAAGLDILGFYHSHPDHEARPSETDREYAWPTYSYVIQAVHKGISLTLSSWVLRDDRSGYDEEQILSQG